MEQPFVALDVQIKMQHTRYGYKTTLYYLSKTERNEGRTTRHDTNVVSLLAVQLRIASSYDNIRHEIDSIDGRTRDLAGTRFLKGNRSRYPTAIEIVDAVTGGACSHFL